MIYKYDLFISHSSKNKDIADYLVEKIESRGYKCFIAPRDINPALEYPVELENGIIHSLAFLLIFSHDADISRHVRTEIDIAFSINKTIIPFRIENILPSKSLAYYLRLPQWLDAFPKILDIHLEEIIKTLKALKNVEIVENQEKTFKIIDSQLISPDNISELGIDYKSLLMKKIEIDYICIPTSAIEKDSEKNSEELHNLRQNFEVENSVLLIKNDEIIGYCDLCPVTKDAYNELVTGKSLLQENMLDVYFSGDTIDICIPMLAILPTHSKLDNYGLIFEWIFQKFLNWYEDEITVNRICISVYSPMLDKIVRKFGFTEQCFNPLNGKIYSTSLAELKENKSVGKSKKYKKFFENIIISEEIKINVDNNPNAKTSENNKTTNEKVFGSETEPLTKITNEKKSAPVLSTAIIPKPKLDAQPMTIAPSKIINENLSSENHSSLVTTEDVQKNECYLSVIKSSPTIQTESNQVHYDFFISYSVRNINTVNRIVEKIEKRGYKCFIASRSIEPTSNFATEIISGIENSSAILVILSSASNQSFYIEREIDSAITYNKFIIPLQIENFIPSKSMKYYVGAIQWIEAISGIQDTHIDKIIELLKIAKQTNSAPKISLDSSTTKKDSEKTSSSPNSSDISKNISRNETISANKEQTKSEIKTNPATKIQPIHVESPKSNPLKTVLEIDLERTQTDNTPPQAVSVPKKNTGSLIFTEKQYSPPQSQIIKPSTEPKLAGVHYDFFILYSSENLDVADYLVEEIEKRGYKCFIASRNIKKNNLNDLDLFDDLMCDDLNHSDYTKEITTGMENSSAIILILSSDSNVSDCVDIEIMLAIALKKPIISFQIEYVILSEELESHLRNIPIIDAYPKILDTHFDSIIETFDTLKNNNYFYHNTKTTTKKVANVSKSVVSIQDIPDYLQTLRKTPLYNDLYTLNGMFYFSGKNEKSDKKIKNAEKAYANLQKDEKSLLCLDTTVFGGADRGLLATTRGIYVNDILVDKAFYDYNDFPILTINATKYDKNFILFESNTDIGIGTPGDWYYAFALIDLLNKFQKDFRTKQKNLSQIIDCKLFILNLIKDKEYLFSTLNERVILFSWYGEDTNITLNSVITKNIKISQSEKFLIFGNLAMHKYEDIISYVIKMKLLPPCSFLATNKGIYFNTNNKYKNIFIEYNEIHSFTAIFQEYKETSPRTKILIYCSEKKYFTIETQLDVHSGFHVVDLLNSLRENFIAN